ncbi:MAG: hypothetical protein NVV73_15390 [Cellvibrionaceae bacterium]|nr:hypothetical protein [Cellvibrionaceae bacterium]
MHLLKRLCAWLRLYENTNDNKYSNDKNRNNKNRNNRISNQNLLSQAAVNNSIARDMGVRVSRVRLPSGEEIVLVEREPQAEDVDGAT